MKIDKLDEEIVRLLGRDARQTSEQLAKKLDVSAATVRRRFRKMIRNDKLRVVGVVKPGDFGYPLSAVITLDVEHDKIEKVIATLSAKREIDWISTTTGRYDIIAGVRLKSIDALSDFVTHELGSLEGLKDSETFICLNEKKDTHRQLI
jgi:Lrp/AsnC family transcriptional regulator, regulator for asnA, asnC and gidA